jgi:phospholipase C
VRLQLAPGSPTNETYLFQIQMNFPSVLPILTRRIPMSFFQQGFADNWNGRNYVSVNVDQNLLAITFDPEIASYYKLQTLTQSLSVSIIEFKNIRCGAIALSIGSGDSPFTFVSGSLPYIQVDVPLLSMDGISDMKITAWGKTLFSAMTENCTLKFYLTVLGSSIAYSTILKSTALNALPTEFPDPGQPGFSINPRQLVIDAIQNWLNGFSIAVGAALQPWLLGAAFDVYSLQHDPVHLPPGADPLGDIVIQYVGQPQVRNGPLANVPTAATQTPTAEIVPAGPATPVALAITTASVASGLVGTAYSQDFAAVGGQAPFSWSVSTNLPPGVSFAGNTLSGTPSTPGAYTFTVTLRDSAGAQVSQGYTIGVCPVDLTITNGQLPAGAVQEPYAVEMTAQGSGPFTWAATSSLPAGISLSAQGILSGTISAAPGVANFIVKVTDSRNVSGWATLSLLVEIPLLFTDPLYAPRGDGNTIWQPPAQPTQFPVHTPEPAQPATTPGHLSKIDHIVVVMMENRSFDHMLGYLSREGGRTDIEGLKWETGAGRTQYNYYAGRYYYPYLLTDTQAISIGTLEPDHSFESVKAQMADGMSHFVSDYAKNKAGDDPEKLKIIMGYYGAEQLPTYDMLARQFAVCDHWFCSHSGPTWPNRFVTLTGELNRDSYGEPEVNTPDWSDFTPSEAPTIFDLLTERGISWNYFQQRASIMRAFTKYSFDMTNVLEAGNPMDANNLLVNFKTKVAAGLPSVTFLDPLFGDLPAALNAPQDNDDAPPSDLKFGQAFISDVVHTLFTPPDLQSTTAPANQLGTNPNWQKTMLIIVYDEHGGFYDHVQPPTDAAPLIAQNSGKLGPRVPAFVVSAWTPAGKVLKDILDHGSIAATILRRFCSPNPPFMSPRVTAALDLRSALSLNTPRGRVFPLLGTRPVFAPMTMRTSILPFTVPQAPDAFGAFLGGIALTLGSTPR